MPRWSDEMYARLLNPRDALLQRDWNARHSTRPDRPHPLTGPVYGRLMRLERALWYLARRGNRPVNNEQDER